MESLIALISMIEKGPWVFDALNPIGPIFVIYISPRGELFSFGWMFEGQPQEGVHMKPSEGENSLAWTEAKEGPYRVCRVDRYLRPNPHLNSQGVQVICIAHTLLTERYDEQIE